MNESWVIKYWITDSGKNEIERWYHKLDKEQAASVTKELALLKRCGNNLKLPLIILLVAGDKSSQVKDIIKAHGRVEELKYRRGDYL